MDNLLQFPIRDGMLRVSIFILPQRDSTFAGLTMTEYDPAGKETAEITCPLSMGDVDRFFDFVTALVEAEGGGE